MDAKSWLPIAEYAGKYRISISTLRRRIKAGEIEYSFSDGKYLLKDAPLAKQQGPVVAPPPTTTGPVSEDETEGSPVLATASRLLNELKRAYSAILQSKEEQILQLREEVADLRTLVRVLESENERLKNSQFLE